jgi:aminopeptidase N
MKIAGAVHFREWRILLILGLILRQASVALSSPPDPIPSRIQEKKQTLKSSPDSDSDLTGGFDALHYRLDLRFPLMSSRFSGTMTLTGMSLRPDLSAIGLHASGLTVRSVRVNDETAAFSESDGLLSVSLPGPSALNDTFQVRVDYEAEPNGIGFYYYDSCAYTMSEPSDARTWFPCKDVPWDKATAELVVTVPAGVEVASNGLLQSRIMSADGEWETFDWKTELPTATYLMCVTMSRHYSRWSDWNVFAGGDSLESQYYIFRWDSAKAREDFLHMTDAIAFFSDRFGPYPFEKYGMAEVAPFAYGGMEHQTMTTINSHWIRGDRSVEDGFVHELAHSWWGDAVTMDDWPDIWLNEGFATYCEALFSEHLYGKESFLSQVEVMRTTFFNQAQKYDFSVYNPPSGYLFNWGIEYNKGGFVLHMLRKTVGDEAFWKIMQTYYETYRYRNASTEDFQNVCESIHGAALDWFFNEWIYQSGYPTFDYSWEIRPQAGSGASVHIALRQAGHPQIPCRMPLDLRVENGVSGKRDTTVWLRRETERFVWTVPFKPDTLILDPENAVLAKFERISDIPDSVNEIHEAYFMRPIYPNPFSKSASVIVDSSIPFSGSSKNVRLCVYNLLGSKVRTLASSIRTDTLSFTGEWDGTDDSGRSLPSGVYVIRLEGDSVSVERKAVLSR